MRQERVRTIPGLRLPPATLPTPELQDAGMPDRLILCLRQHVGLDSVPCVRLGDRVRAGDVVATAGAYVGMVLHAPTSGRIEHLGMLPEHPALGPVLALSPDGRNERCARMSPLDWSSAAPDALRQRIAAAGIVGLGGAGFPTHVKLRESASQRVETVIVNAVECEPGISCDDRLVRDRAPEVISGARILMRAVGAGVGLIALKDGMGAAQVALAEVGDAQIAVRMVPAIYPAGGEKQLIYLLTGVEVPAGGLPVHVGVLMQNAATTAAIHGAVVTGEPMTRRIVTVTGAVAQPGNYEVLLGTPIAHLLSRAGGALDAHARVVIGGPMMGQPVDDLLRPVTKTTNCVRVEPPARAVAEQPCIRCGRCDAVCPVRLQPEALWRYSRAGDLDRAQDLHLFDCIECGCCAYVCPSHIPLVAVFRRTKHAVDAAARAERAAERAHARSASTSARRARDPESADTDAGVPVRPAIVQSERDYVRAALERVRARRSARADGSDPRGGK